MYAVFNYTADLKQRGRNIIIKSHLCANIEEMRSFSNYKLVELLKFNASKPGDLQIMSTLLPHGPPPLLVDRHTCHSIRVGAELWEFCIIQGCQGPFLPPPLAHQLQQLNQHDEG